MSGTQQPEALRLARKFEEVGFMGDHRFAKDHWCRQAAAELRSQHARIAELEAQLSAIGAGGVEPLRKAAATPIAWYVTGCSTMLDEHDAKAEAKRCGGSAKAVPLYTVPRGLAATQPAAQGVEQPIKWPKARDVGRFGDMSPDGSIRVGLDADNDVYVSICDGTSVADIEFCTPGGGGGRSSRTRMALIALMCAIEADNASHPAFDFWQRNLAAQAKQGEQA